MMLFEIAKIATGCAKSGHWVYFFDKHQYNTLKHINNKRADIIETNLSALIIKG